MCRLKFASKIYQYVNTPIEIVKQLCYLGTTFWTSGKFRWATIENIRIIKDTLHSIQINLNSNIELIAIKTYNPNSVTICSIYIPPNLNPNSTQIDLLINQLPKPYMLAGKLNAPNQIWGLAHTSRLGKINWRLFTKYVPNERRNSNPFLNWYWSSLKYRPNLL